jgi:TRAP-type C4-dicarboxylate transport system permease small subunit
LRGSEAISDKNGHLWLKTARVLEKVIHGLETFLNSIGIIMFLGLMLLGAADVIGRYALNSPIRGAKEVSSILMVGMVILTWAFTQSRKANVQVEILFSRYPPRVKLILELVILILSLAFFSLIVWEGSVIAWKDWLQHREIDTIFIPLAPFKLIIPVGAFLLCLEFIVQLVHLVPEMKKKEN